MSIQIVKRGGEIMQNKKMIEKRGSKTQAEVAKVIGITNAYYSMIENGLRTPPYYIMKRIAEYYGVKPDYFFYSKD